MKKLLISFILIAICCFAFACDVIIENKIKDLGPPDEVLPNNSETWYVWDDIKIGNVTHTLGKPDEVYQGIFPGKVPKISLLITLTETYDSPQIFQNVFRWENYYFFEVTNWDGSKNLVCIHTDREWKYKINIDKMKMMWNKLSEAEQKSMLERAIKSDGSHAVKKGLIIVLGFTDEQAQTLTTKTEQN